MRVNADATIRAGTQDYKVWQIRQNDGETPVDLSLATRVIMRLQDEETGEVTEFATDDASPILYIKDATVGKVELRPGADTFDEDTSYLFHFIVVDSIGNHPVPEDHDGHLKVINSYPP